MKNKAGFYLGVATLALAFAFTGSPAQLNAQQPAPVAIDSDDIGGNVIGPNGPEAGVWVIAETRDLPTRFARMVVTDDQGRYVLPDLPKAKYQIWVRGYGLVDSPKVESERGRELNCAQRLRPMQPPPPSTIRPSTGTPCSKFQMRASSAARARSLRRSSRSTGST